MSREALRVYAGCCLGTGPTRPARHVDGQPDTNVPHTAERSRPADPNPQAPAVLAPTPDRALSRILDNDPLGGESVQAAFDRKERELRALFMSLTQTEAAELLERVSIPDHIRSLSRLTADRRSRLLTFLTAVAKGRVVQQ